ncbi:MAG: glycosyltransferase, partial [Lysobacterales bacterium]
MKILLVTFGSRGDVHPMLGLGRALQARGHEAVLLTNPVFREEAVRAGLGFVPVGTEEDYRQTLAHPKLWHPVDGLGVMWRYLLRPALRPTYEALHRLGQSLNSVNNGNSIKGPLVVASPMAMGARVAQEKLGIQLVTAYTAATMLRSVQDPLTIAQRRVPKAVPRWVRRSVWRLLDRTKLDPLVKPALESLRGEMGLPPLNGAVFEQWVHSPLGGLTLFPPWFAPAPSDWPAQVRQGTFPLYDDTDVAGSD